MQDHVLALNAGKEVAALLAGKKTSAQKLSGPFRGEHFMLLRDRLFIKKRLSDFSLLIEPDRKEQLYVA
jgi:hypothetical protein